MPRSKSPTRRSAAWPGMTGPAMFVNWRTRWRRLSSSVASVPSFFRAISRFRRDGIRWLIQPGTQPMIAVPDQGLDFERTVGSIELNILEQALRKTRGNKKLAAQMLGLKRTTLTAKLKSLAAVGAAG